MTHNRIILVICLCSLLMIHGCGFLEENPESLLPEEAVITSASVLHNQAVLYLYNYIGSHEDGKGIQGMYRGIYDLQTFASNEAMIPTRGGDWYDGGLWQELYYHRWQVDNECCENAWVYLYQLIGLCNHSLGLLDEYSALLTAEQMKAYSAEVRAVRAMCYMYLVDLFARVPIITKHSISVHDVVQSPRSEVFRFIWEELQAVYPNLVDARSNSRGVYYGRVTKPVAAFMLMKMALNAEVWTDDDWTDAVRPSGDTILLCCDSLQKNTWEAVVFYGDEILGSLAGYELCESMNECFAVYNEEAKENIFTIPMDPSVYRHRFKNLFRSLHYQHASALGYGGENGSCATPATLDVFGYGTNQTDVRFRTSFYAGLIKVNDDTLFLSNGDPLIYQPREVKIDLTGSPFVATAGARMQKYAYDVASIFDGQLRNSDIVLFRLADVYLMIAEAKVRAGQSGQEEFDLIRIREVVNAPGAVYRPRKATLENIYYERWMELVWEGWHRQDMIRFDCYAYPGEFQDLMTPSPNRYLQVFPIPKTARETNPNLKQNPGYL